MPTITATTDSVKSQVRLDLDFSDIDAPYAYVTRVDPTTGASTAVRGHGSSTTIAGLPYAPLQAGYKGVLYDTEVPLDSTCYYVATAPSVTLNANPTFAGGYTDPWWVTNQAITIRLVTNAGVNFLSFFTGGATANPTIRADDVPATPGTTFTVTAVLSANVSQAVLLGLTYFDASGSVLLNTSTSSTVLTSTTVVFASTAPANTVSVQAFVSMSGTPAATTVVSVASVAITNAAGAATSGGVLVQSLGSCQLKDPLRPGFNVRVDFAFDPNPLCTPSEGVFFQSMDVESQAPNAATFNVNNQANPIVVSKVRSSVASTLTLVSRTFPDRDRLDALLAPGSPLLFQTPDEYGVPDRYLSVGGETKTRVLPDHRFPIRVFGLPFQAVSSPGGPMQGTIGARWSDTCNRYATWAAVNAAALTWIQVLDGLAG